MDTTTKGKFAESLVLAELLKHDFKVAIPFGDSRYDFIVERNGQFKRVQVKFISKLTKRSAINVVLHSITRNGRKCYSKNDIDCVIAYYQPDNEFFIIPYEQVAGKTAICIRKKDTLNNQKSGIIEANTYRDRWDLLL